MLTELDFGFVSAATAPVAVGWPAVPCDQEAV